MLAGMRPQPVICPATTADRPAIIAVLAAAFADDPALAWIFPDAVRRPARASRLPRSGSSPPVRRSGDQWRDDLQSQQQRALQAGEIVV